MLSSDESANAWPTEHQHGPQRRRCVYNHCTKLEHSDCFYDLRQQTDINLHALYIALSFHMRARHCHNSGVRIVSMQNDFGLLQIIKC